MPEIAIDACVFVHLLNPQNNPNKHIDRLLNSLRKANLLLLVDSTGRIENDYDAQVKPLLKSLDETGFQAHLLRYWLLYNGKIKIQVNLRDELMIAIKDVIYEIDEHADRAFVYVACKNNSDLITNDKTHILKRRQQLLKRTKKRRGANTTIISSLEACERIPECREAQ